MTYFLIWNKEKIEENIPTRKEALYLLREYRMAFNDHNIKIGVEKLRRV